MERPGEQQQQQQGSSMDSAALSALSALSFLSGLSGISSPSALSPLSALSSLSALAVAAGEPQQALPHDGAIGAEAAEEALPSPTHISQLPPVLLATVLQHVPQQHRLSCCSLVSTSWAAAATAATTHLTLEVTAERLPLLLPWLAQYGPQLLGLQLSWKAQQGSSPGHSPGPSPSHPLLQLQLDHLPHLQQLSLTGFDLLLLPEVLSASGSDTGASSHSIDNGSEAAPDSSSSGSSIGTARHLGGLQQRLAGLRDLGQLGLHQCRLPSPDSFTQLAAAATRLTCLDVSWCVIPSWFTTDHTRTWPTFTSQEVKRAITSMLQQHQQLSVVQLPTHPLGHTAAQLVCRLRGLKDVSVCLAFGQSASGLADLPSSITRLQVDNRCNRRQTEDQDDEVYFISEDGPSDTAEEDMSEKDEDASSDVSRMPLQHLTRLVDLHLEYAAISAAELAELTQMQRLVLHGCTLLPQGEREAAEGVSALLSTLAGYAQLQHLQLCELGLGENSGNLAPERFAALTASPELTYLGVLGEYGPAPLPIGVVQCMFSAGRQLPLRKVVILPTYGVEALFNSPEGCMTGAELSSLVSSCPELQVLHITGAVHPGDMAMTGLLQLPPSCTQLCIGGLAVCDAEVPVLQQLRHVRVLGCWDAPDLTDVGVEQLTALTWLSALEVGRCDGLSEELGGHPRFNGSFHLRDDGDEPVWRQLQALCKTSSQLNKVEGPSAAAD